MSCGRRTVYYAMMERETKVRLFVIDLSGKNVASVDQFTTCSFSLTSVSRWTATAFG